MEAEVPLWSKTGVHPLQPEEEMIISKDLFLLGDQDYLRLPKDDKRAMVHKNTKR